MVTLNIVKADWNVSAVVVVALIDFTTAIPIPGGGGSTMRNNKVPSHLVDSWSDKRLAPPTISPKVAALSAEEVNHPQFKKFKQGSHEALLHAAEATQNRIHQYRMIYAMEMQDLMRKTSGHHEAVTSNGKKKAPLTTRKLSDRADGVWLRQQVESKLLEQHKAISSKQLKKDVLVRQQKLARGKAETLLKVVEKNEEAMKRDRHIMSGRRRASIEKHKINLNLAKEMTDINPYLSKGGTNPQNYLDQLKWQANRSHQVAEKKVQSKKKTIKPFENLPDHLEFQ